MRKALALSLVFVVVGCASTVPDQTRAQQLYSVQSDFVAIQGLALKYESRPRCGPAATTADKITTCSLTEVVVEIRKVNNTGQTAILEAQKIAPTADASTFAGKIKLAIDATVAIRNIIAAYGVK